MEYSFTKLVLSRRDEMLHLARRLTRCPTLADDLMQDVYIRAVRAWSRWRPPPDATCTGGEHSDDCVRAAARAWIARIVKNTFLNQESARKVYESKRLDYATSLYAELGLNLSGMDSGLETADKDSRHYNREHNWYAQHSQKHTVVPRPALDELERDQEAEVARARVAGALGEIYAGYRDVLRLHYEGELTISQIAEQLGVQKGTVLSRLARGRKELEPKLRERVDVSGRAGKDPRPGVTRRRKPVEVAQPQADRVDGVVARAQVRHHDLDGVQQAADAQPAG